MWQRGLGVRQRGQQQIRTWTSPTASPALIPSTGMQLLPPVATGTVPNVSRGYLSWPAKMSGDFHRTAVANPFHSTAEFEMHLAQHVQTGIWQRSWSLRLQTATYCHDPRCQTFIPPAAVDGKEGVVARCPLCHKQTCTQCKNAAHESAACPTDRADEQVLRLARQRNWQRCLSCRSIVERNLGCNEISE